MKIVSLIRRETVGLPTTYVVGQIPFVTDTEPNENEALVKSIVFFQNGAYSQTKEQTVTFKGFLGPCYLISFMDSPIKRVIPAEQMVDLAIDSEPGKREAKKTATELVDAADTEAGAIPET